MEKARIDIHKLGYIPAKFFNGHWFIVTEYMKLLSEPRKKRKKKRHSTRMSTLFS